MVEEFQIELQFYRSPNGKRIFTGPISKVSFLCLKALWQIKQEVKGAWLCKGFVFRSINTHQMTTSSPTKGELEVQPLNFL